MSEYVTTMPDAALWAAASAAVLLLGVLVWGLVRAVGAARAGLTGVPGSVRVAAVAAAACTAYSGDTSWRFAEHWLDMVSTPERAALFAAGELALFACAVMARDSFDKTGSPGTPGLLVWVITGVQIIPAYAEGGLVGGTVRAFFGPVAAALLWHLAMGLEIRHRRPEAASQGLLAALGRELRERLLSRLGVAARNRTAEQITRDRWTVRAVDLAARLERLPEGARHRRGRVERRLSRAVGRSGVGQSLEQRRALLDQLAARRSAAQLATITLDSPWEQRDPMAAGRSPRALAGAELRQMPAMDAVLAVADAHPEMRPAQLAAVVTEHGVPVSETMVSIALRERRPARIAAALAASDAGLDNIADLREVSGAAPEQPYPTGRDAHSDAHPDPDAPEVDDDQDDDEPWDPDPLLDEARAIDERHIAAVGRPAGLRIFQARLRIGQGRAQRIRQQLDRAAVTV